MSWVGGKKALREEVVKRFPLFYERYVEVFGGGGWVLFHKAPGNDFEVYNDYNGLLANLYRCVRDKPDLLINALKYVLNSREDFDRARLALRRKRTDRYSAGNLVLIKSSARATPPLSPALPASLTICGATSRSLSRPTDGWRMWWWKTRTSKH